jgi:hypothetical protein
MAFTGSATIKKVSDNLFRITGLSLAGIGTSGTIGLDGGSGDVDLTVGEDWGAYGSVSLQDAVRCLVVLRNNGATDAVACQITVQKAGTTPADFLITLRNESANDSPPLEIWVEFH